MTFPELADAALRAVNARRRDGRPHWSVRRRLLRPEDAADVLAAALESIRAELRAGNAVRLSGFGTFAPKPHRSRAAVNPATGERMTLPHMVVAAFSPSETWKILAALDGGEKRATEE